MYPREIYKSVFEHFGLKVKNVSAESIYPFAPVFKALLEGQQVIIKKTKTPPLSRAKALIAWTTALVRSGVQVVTPFENRPPVLINDEVWIMYPFIEGAPYTGSERNIIAAARLLRELHSRADGDYGLPSFVWSQYGPDFIEEVNRDLVKLERLVTRERIPDGADLIHRFSEMVKHCINTSLPVLKTVNFVQVNGPWDYKANNLIYRDEDGDSPMLVDPDNAGRIPRIFDLALTLLLFHNETPTAAARPFTVKEWEIFRQSYFVDRSPTATERTLWSDFLEFVFVDEVLWLILEDWDYAFHLQGKRNDRQKNFIRSLLEIEPHLYSL